MVVKMCQYSQCSLYEVQVKTEANRCKLCGHILMPLAMVSNPIQDLVKGLF